MEPLDLRDYLAILRRRFWVLISVPAIAALTAAVLSLYVIAPVYQASATLLVTKKETPITDYNSLLLARNLVKTYGEIAKSRTVVERVRADLNLTDPIEEIQKRIEVDTLRDTEIIRISAEGTGPDAAATLANAVSRAFITQVVAIMKVENVQVVDPAVDPQRPVKPRPLVNTAVALALGGFAALGLVFLMEHLDNTIKSADDAGRTLGLPVLASIPTIDPGHEQRRASG